MLSRECEYCGQDWSHLGDYAPNPEHDCYVRIRREEWEAVLARLAAVEDATRPIATVVRFRREP